MFFLRRAEGLVLLDPIGPCLSEGRRLCAVSRGTACFVCLLARPSYGSGAGRVVVRRLAYARGLYRLSRSRT